MHVNDETIIGTASPTGIALSVVQNVKLRPQSVITTTVTNDFPTGDKVLLTRKACRRTAPTITKRLWSIKRVWERSRSVSIFVSGRTDRQTGRAWRRRRLMIITLEYHMVAFRLTK
jgi:hypothetical protein